ncbi:class I SAM-dependent methyltransferase [Actinokineospora bangkokensis]|uniref:Methyltransferase domain-containing protein n=1 Tax=Actinokineospora bangkokensis TaxID=1193682 RepID=A0A1Q9LKS7_9PSEU|nr:class I SAM-dependent methyltransferase [Actinokineospora bangkokensis]OLR92657.1 hypothetical protein BJP25_21735 [Actinokineospora bangkokensis]
MHGHAQQQGHGHGDGHSDEHEHGHDRSFADMGEFLEREAGLHRQFVDDVAAWLGGLVSTPVTRVVDAGSGPGVGAVQLARAFPDARVVALDPERVLLDRAVELAAAAGVGDRFEVVEAALPHGVDGLAAADLVWSKLALHHVGDQQAAVAALAGLVRRGGVVAVIEGGLPMRTLPRDIGVGRPGLEARLDGLAAEWFEHMRAQTPGSTTAVEDWGGMLRAAGLTPSGTKTFVADLPAPLAQADREVLFDRWRRTRERLGDKASAEDREALDVLLDRDDPRGFPNREDVYFLHAMTVHTARRD